MLRLTLRSSRDGRFLCRIVDRGGFTFVLDFGDRRVIDDASQRLQHGFTAWRHGRLVTVAAQQADMIPLLADFYASEGLLIFLEEPTWPGRGHSLEDRLPGPAEPALGPDDPTRSADDDDATAGHLDIEDASTEIIGRSDIPSVDAFLEDDDGS